MPRNEFSNCMHTPLTSHTAWTAALIFFSITLANGQDYQKTDKGIDISIGSANVELAVATPTAFRLSVSLQGKPVPGKSTFLAPEVKDDTTPWQIAQQDGLVGIASAAGKLLIDPKSGKWTLEDTQGAVLIPPSDLAKPGTEEGPHKTTLSGLDLPLAWKSGSDVQVYGCGNGASTLQQAKAHTRLGNGTAIEPYYWSPNGYAVLAVAADDNAPAYWDSVQSQPLLTWHFPGASANLYLMPAPTLDVAARAYAQLSGFAPVPPLWTFGYMQSRWGWKDEADIEDVLSHFKSLKIPLDCFIFDFEWYAVKPDYKLAVEGSPDFDDFGFNPLLFPRPKEQLANFLAQGVHFVGIRKPRIGNSASISFFKDKGWLLPTDSKSYHARDIDFANPDVRAWYAEHSQPLLQDGVSGWWNDEGEATYTTFYHWNEAELAAFQQGRPGERFWSLNRSFSPGSARLGATVWTGDVKTRWDFFQRTCTDLLNYSLSGESFCGCDIGGFMPLKGDPDLSPELLSRWMEAGTFFPIMRTHSDNKVTPHFPWLFGPDAQAAITKAIELRYRLIPYYYSLAYETHDTGMPMMRPLIMDFPDDAKVANLSDQWTMGSGLMVAPIEQQGATSRDVYLPAGRWFSFESTKVQDGSQSITATAKLDEIPLYVRAGTILPLGPVVQNTAELPGGPLDLEIYPGKDTTFTLVQDDGASTQYLNGAYSKTTFIWNDAAHQLSWTTEGTYSGPHSFKQMAVSLFDPSGKKERTVPLDPKGSIQGL
jgi:alpha-glucosidase